MKKINYALLLLAICTFSLTSCSKENLEEELTSVDLVAQPSVEYTVMEVQVMELVNAYREQQGLTALAYLNEGSIQAASHNDHMIANDEVCHDFFGNRYEALVNSVNAKAVSENVAFGYRTAEAVVNAWIKSDSHRHNMTGSHTHFGISIKEGKDGKFYFTNIFVKK